MKSFRIISKLSFLTLILAIIFTLNACAVNVYLKEDDDESSHNQETNVNLFDNFFGSSKEDSITEEDNDNNEIIIEDEFDFKSENVNPSFPEASSTDDLAENPINFNLLQKSHPDACAWIAIPGIEVIDYPIMQSGFDVDDNFYLDHDISGNEDRAGSIYIQKLNKNDFSDPNTVIYGHEMLNKTMFGRLSEFKQEDFFNEHKTIYIYTPGHIFEYQIISAFIYDDRHILNSFNFSDKNERMEFFNTCVNPKSNTKQLRKGATLNPNDKIITLSTGGSENANERFLVIGKLIKKIDTK